MQGQGFAEVYNLAGGIKAWDGLAATGPESWGLELMEPGQGPAAVLAAAYGLERGLALFYQALAQRSAGAELSALFRRLAGIEVRHQERLQAMHQALPLAQQQEAPLEQVEPVRMEGGYTWQEFLEQQREALAGPEAALMLAMGIETQALDLYMRLAQRAQPEESRQTLLGIADEEQAHLRALGQMLEQVQAG
ncbi:MAG: ferritin family protein [Thermodesulfobacteriota bacterium]